MSDSVIRKTAAQFTSENPILGITDMGFETDTDRFKFGDGVAHWNSLPYFPQGGGGSVDLLSPGPIGTVTSDIVAFTQMKVNGVTYNWPANAGTSGQVLRTNGTNTLTWVNPGGGGAVSSVNSQTGAVVLDTDDIAEGAVNFYYTDGRVAAYLTAPGPIGGTTPNSAAFTQVIMTGPIVMAESADFSTAGYLFGESGNDTGFTSPSDGVIHQYGNSQLGMVFEYIGPTQIRGVPIQFPAAQGAAGTVLTNVAGDGIMDWVAPATNGPAYTVAGFNTGGALSQIPNWIYDSVSAGMQHNGAAASIGDTFFVRDSSNYTAMTASYVGFELRNSIGDITVNYNGFNDNNNILHAFGDIRNFSVVNTWAQVDGSIYQFLAQPTVTLSGGNVHAFTDATQVLDMPGVGFGYVSYDAGPSVATGLGTSVQAFGTFNTHPQVGTVVYDFAGWEDGSNVDHVMRNVNFMNHHPNFVKVDGNYNAYLVGPHVATVSGGSFSEINLNSLVDSLAYNYQGITITPRMTEAALVAADFTVGMTADVAGSLAGASFSFGLPYSSGGNTYTPWLKVSGVGTAPASPNPIEVDIANGDSPATIATAVYAALVAFGAPITTTMDLTDLGGSVQFVAKTAFKGAGNIASIQNNPTAFTIVYTTYGAGDGNATGVYINMGQVNGFTAAAMGPSRVKAFDSNGGTFSLQVTAPMQEEANARPINSMNTQFSAAPSATITNCDNFGFSAQAFLQISHDAHISSGSFGVGTAAAGGLILMQLDDSSTVADVAGHFLAAVPIGGTGAGGIVGMIHGYEFAGIPGSATGSPTLMTSAKAFEARSPAGPFTTGTAWGVYAESGYGQNWFAGAVKIGGTAGSTDVVSDPQWSFETQGASHGFTSFTDSGGLTAQFDVAIQTTVDSSDTGIAVQAIANAAVDTGATNDKQVLAFNAAVGRAGGGTDQGTLENLTGYQVLMTHNSDAAGTTNKVFGFTTTNFMQAGTVDRLYDFYSVAIPMGATVNNHYGLYLDDAGSAVASNNWGVYAKASFEKNYLGGSLKIGATGGDTPATQLEVAGTIRAKVGSGVSSYEFVGSDNGNIVSLAVPDDPDAYQMYMPPSLLGSTAMLVDAFGNGHTTWQALPPWGYDPNTSTDIWTLSKVGIGTMTPAGALDLTGADTTTLLSLNSSTSSTNKLNVAFDGSNLNFAFNGEGVQFYGAPYFAFYSVLDTSNGANLNKGTAFAAVNVGGTDYATVGVPLTTTEIDLNSFAWNGSDGSTLQSFLPIKLVQLSATTGDARLDIGTSIHQMNLTGDVGIGTSAPTARLDVQGGPIRFPNMDTATRDAISPASGGMAIFNTDTLALECYNGSAWV